jgi:light-regulated signal transduction histidine kinase (bacteriophytochrome)
VDIHAQKLVEETLKDNNELKDAQKKLVDYQKRLEDKISELNLSNHELEQFAYIASHDLQEPLRKIITFSSLLVGKIDALDESSQLYFNKIVFAAKRMSQLINDVLNWSVVSKVKADLSEVDLNVVVEGIKSDFEIVIQQKQAVIQHSALPIISGVSFQIRQVFGNLISNSLKFSKGSPLIRIFSRDLTSAEIAGNKRLSKLLTYAEITIADNGIGFEQEYSELIFKIFQRLHSLDAYNGTGIGLAICKKIIENHAGTIAAVGELDQGATFTLILPTCPRPSQPEREATEVNKDSFLSIDKAK